MAQVIADRRDIDFVLYEQLEVEEILENDEFQGLDKKTADLIISEARNLAVKEILPTFSQGDKEGLSFDNGAVKVPECFKRPYELLKEGEWIACKASPDVGGQGLPSVLAQAVTDYLAGANYPFTMFGYSTYGAGETIEVFGTEAQKSMYLKKLYSGEWGGTMVLTEPSAGSDVGALTTTAVKNSDGTYSISGNKIFITNAEHDMCENFIHPVLARIEGAPAGSKGISLFIVPKIWVNEDGSLGEFNDVVCTGIEEKMGMHTSPTCSMTFGGKGRCRGLLLGEENKGMKVMFHLMNAARLLVGAIGQTSSSTAYLHALNYARERMQGRALENILDPSAPQVAIINHPDVRRMLMWMKAHVDGMRSFIFFGALCLDQEKCAKTEGEKSYYKNLLDLLTPVIKSYCTDKGVDVCSEAMQVFGGYGYTKDFPVEQLLRDVRIAPIYEGTNGIQAMDLIGRKLGMNKGLVFIDFLNEISKVTNQAKEDATLSALGDKLDGLLEQFKSLAMHMGENMMSENFKTPFLHAVPFQDIMGDICMAWMLLWRGVTAAGKLSGGAKKKDREFYQGQITTAQFFINTILPVTRGKIESILSDDASALHLTDAGFGG